MYARLSELIRRIEGRAGEGIAPEDARAAFLAAWEAKRSIEESLSKQARRNDMKVGFIDYYLDEWHADHYPDMLKEASRGSMEVRYAYGMVPSPRSGKTSEEWCREHGIQCCRTIEEVVEKSDVLMVLAPEDAQTHEHLSKKALESGKRTYIDKTFASSREMAEAIFALAESCGTPCCSTSALRYASEYQPFMGRRIQAAAFVGASDYNNYSIHLLEPMLMLMEGKVQRVMALTRGDWTQVVLAWEDGRIASMLCTGGGTAFTAHLLLDEGCEQVDVESDFFGLFMEELVRFFETGEILVPHEETVRIIAVREAGAKAMERPGEWVEVGRGSTGG